jgi:hypothetical protein
LVAASSRAPDRRPRRKEDDLESGSMTLLRRPVQRGRAIRGSVIDVRAAAEGARCRAQQASQAGTSPARAAAMRRVRRFGPWCTSRTAA